MKFILLLITYKLFAIEPTQIQSVASYHTTHNKEVTAISYVESRCGSNVGVNRIAKGIMQIEPRTARWIATKDNRLRWISKCTDKQLCYVLLHNNYLNIMVGSRLLDYNIKRYGYNNGIARYNKIGNTTYLKMVKGRL